LEKTEMSASSRKSGKADVDASRRAFARRASRMTRSVSSESSFVHEETPDDEPIATETHVVPER
jgi:hypothetical protein